MIAIVDYGMGNLRSVFNVFHALGEKAEIINEPAKLKSFGAIVLPGVGAFGDAMNNLRRSGLKDALDEEVMGKGKPFLGICLGIQLIATTGFEHGEHQGLGWIPGTVERLRGDINGSRLRVPHMGWNDVKFTRKDGLSADMGESKAFYFVHSYVPIPKDPSVITGVCNYGADFAAVIEHRNICATQFHPEKSQKAGFALLKNWVTRSVKCLKPA